MVGLSGRLICANTAELMIAMALLPAHITASRAEPGCLRFDLWQDDDPHIWHLREVFTDDAAFAAHQTRTAASEWGQASTAIRRDFDRRAMNPLIRAETAADHDAIDALLNAAFDTETESALVRNLRADGDLPVSLIAHADGVAIGHAALSPLTAERPAFALAPVAVHPAMQTRGLGLALTRAAIAAANGAPVVVLGDPAYYARAGFQPADLQSPYTGDALQIYGDLPKGSAITHAPAFARL